jgi:hypothetical protein
MDNDTKFSIPPQVMSRLVGEETIILDLESGMYFGLDAVGKRIWESISDGNTLSETVDIVAKEYEVEEDRAAADLAEFANDLLERGLLKIA